MSTTEITVRPTESTAVSVPAPSEPAEMALPRDPYEGIASAPFPPKAQEILMRDLDDQDIEIRPDDGMLYLPGVRYRQRLNAAFGLGGWGLRPKGEPKVNGNQVFYTAQLYCLGRFVAEAMGEGKWVPSNPKSSYGTALESAKTDALTRCCKDIGIATQLWDPSFARRWKHEWAVHIRNPDSGRFGRSDYVWVRVDDPCYAKPGQSRDDLEAYRATVQDSRPGPMVQPPPTTTASPVPAGPTQGGSSVPKAAPGVDGQSRAGTSPAPATPRTVNVQSANGTGSTQSGTATSKRNDSGARDIVHDGVMASAAQVKRIHILRAKIPTLNATPEHPESAWKKTVRVYRKQDGSRCEHSNEMSKAQASHLIQRMEEKAGKLEAAEAEIRNGTDSRAETVPPTTLGFDNPVNWLEFIHDSFFTATEEAQFLTDIGYQSAEDVPADSRELVAKMIRSLRSPDAFKAAWKEAKEKGALRI